MADGKSMSVLLMTVVGIAILTSLIVILAFSQLSSSSSSSSSSSRCHDAPTTWNANAMTRANTSFTFVLTACGLMRHLEVEGEGVVLNDTGGIEFEEGTIPEGHMPTFGEVQIKQPIPCHLTLGNPAIQYDARLIIFNDGSAMIATMMVFDQESDLESGKLGVPQVDSVDFIDPEFNAEEFVVHCKGDWMISYEAISSTASHRQTGYSGLMSSVKAYKNSNVAGKSQAQIRELVKNGTATAGLRRSLVVGGGGGESAGVRKRARA